jgi:3-dehydroquinate synthase
MVQAFRLSARLGLCPQSDAERVAAHLAGLGFTIEPAALGLNCTAARLVEHVKQDKKMSAGRLAFILARGIGQSFVSRDFELADVEAFLAEQLTG